MISVRDKAWYELLAEMIHARNAGDDVVLSSGVMHRMREIDNALYHYINRHNGSDVTLADSFPVIRDNNYKDNFVSRILSLGKTYNVGLSIIIDDDSDMVFSQDLKTVWEEVIGREVGWIDTLADTTANEETDDGSEDDQTGSRGGDYEGSGVAGKAADSDGGDGDD